jgi:hypothetical protein
MITSLTLGCNIDCPGNLAKSVMGRSDQVTLAWCWQGKGWTAGNQVDVVRNYLNKLLYIDKVA